MSGTRVTGGHEPVRVYTHCLPKGFERPSAYYRLNAVDQGRIHWDLRHKAVVIDGQNCTWSSENIGMASVVKVGNRLAVFYDAREGSEINHFHRDIGLAWLDLPLIPPEP